MQNGNKLILKRATRVNTTCRRNLLSFYQDMQYFSYKIVSNEKG